MANPFKISTSQDYQKASKILGALFDDVNTIDTEGQFGLLVNNIQTGETDLQYFYNSKLHTVLTNQNINSLLETANGIENNNGTLELGGTLNANKQIVADANRITFVSNGNFVSNYPVRVLANASITADIGFEAQLITSSFTTTGRFRSNGFLYESTSPTSFTSSLQFTSSGQLIYSSSLSTAQGIVYSNINPNNFVAQSLVPKEWIENYVATNVPNLQQVTDVNNSTSNPLIVNNDGSFNSVNFQVRGSNNAHLFEVRGDDGDEKSIFTSQILTGEDKELIKIVGIDGTLPTGIGFGDDRSTGFTYSSINYDYDNTYNRLNIEWRDGNSNWFKWLELEGNYITNNLSELIVKSRRIEYFDDFSANYTDRSLIDRGYLNTQLTDINTEVNKSVKSLAILNSSFTSTNNVSTVIGGTYLGSKTILANTITTNGYTVEIKVKGYINSDGTGDLNIFIQNGISIIASKTISLSNLANQYFSLEFIGTFTNALSGTFRGAGNIQIESGNYPITMSSSTTVSTVSDITLDVLVGFTQGTNSVEIYNYVMNKYLID